MNREIKFRVWDNISKQMHLNGIVKHHPLTDFDLEHYSLMQFTGLKDKNGKEIYEGDILSYSIFGYDDYDKQFKGVVKWIGTGFIVTQIPDSLCNGEFGIELDWVHNQDMGLEVIGNIHENPELL